MKLKTKLKWNRTRKLSARFAARFEWLQATNAIRAIRLTIDTRLVFHFSNKRNNSNGSVWQKANNEATVKLSECRCICVRRNRHRECESASDRNKNRSRKAKCARRETRAHRTQSINCYAAENRAWSLELKKSCTLQFELQLFSDVIECLDGSTVMIYRHSTECLLHIFIVVGKRRWIHL